MKKRTIRNILIFLIVGAITAACIIVVIVTSGKQYDGKITLRVADLEGNISIDDEIHFSSDDKLWDLMLERYEIEYETSATGIFITDINSIVSGNNSVYWALYINDKYANVGVSSVVLEDNMVILWQVTSL